jgi:hypothetical protein
LVSEGLRNAGIANRVWVSRPTVTVWQSRHVDAGITRLVDQRKITAETLRRRRERISAPDH